MHIIFEGVDNAGKGTVIRAFQNKYGGRVQEQGKPRLLFRYLPENSPETRRVLRHYIKYGTSITTREVYNAMMYVYQKKYIWDMFGTMFNVLSDRYYSELPKISKENEYHTYYNTLHLSEYVYGSIYRSYTPPMAQKGFDIESKYVDTEKLFFLEPGNNVFLVLLNVHTKNEQNLKYYYDPTEQKRFIDAFNMSKLKKCMVYTNNENGEWRDPEEIVKEIDGYVFNKFYLK